MAKVNLKFNWDDTLEKLKKDKTDEKGDKRFWKLTKDKKTEEGSALIRFLPDKSGVPYVLIFQHFLEYMNEEGFSKWYAGTCPTTIQKDCPICELNKKYWNSGHEQDKEIARKRKRKKTYISNILVLKDEDAPENEGKVFLFSYGTKIFDKIQDKVFPKNNYEDPIVVWDLFEGSNFILQSQQVKGSETNSKLISYDNSKFTKVEPLFKGDEDKLTEIMEQTYDLSEFLNPEKIDSAQVIKEKLPGIFDNIGNPITPIKTSKTVDDDYLTESKTLDVDKLSDLEDDIPF